MGNFFDLKEKTENRMVIGGWGAIGGESQSFIHLVRDALTICPSRFTSIHTLLINDNSQPIFLTRHTLKLREQSRPL